MRRISTTLTLAPAAVIALALPALASVRKGKDGHG
jgi:hypothetical protein